MHQDLKALKRRGLWMKFERHVERFIQEHALLQAPRVALALSAGVDSMSLLSCLVELSKRSGFKLRALHVHHGTREGQDAEERLVRKVCKELNVSLVVIRLDLARTRPNALSNNFEAQARALRYQNFEGHLRDDEILVTAHHIDDSFEWSLMQGLKTSDLTSSLGIPLVNKRAQRPFMCVSKKQIRYYAKCKGVRFSEDPTNQDEKHLRNFCRRLIKEEIAPRFPQYLQHYVHRQNQLARKLGKHVMERAHEQGLPTIHSVYRKRQGVVEIFALSESSQVARMGELLLAAFQLLAPGTRGKKVFVETQKLLKSIAKGNYGVFRLAQDLYVYASFNHLLVSASKVKLVSLEELPRQITFNEFQNKALKKLKGNDGRDVQWPYWVILESKTFNLESGPHADFGARLPQHGKEVLMISALKLYKYWSKAANRNKTLRCRLLFA